MVMFSIILICSRSSSVAQLTCFRFLFFAGFASGLAGLVGSADSRLIYSSTENLEVLGCFLGGAGFAGAALLVVDFTAPPAVMPIERLGVVDLVRLF